jgi:hypothetical protein
MNDSASASTLALLGAGGFGAVIGWYVYYLNRYRKADIQLSDLVTVIGAIGGAAILALFPAKSDLFGAYGIGLFAGFFGYLLTLALMVRGSEKFTIEWFLDGRRRKLADDEIIPGEIQGTVRPMEEERGGLDG